MTHACYKASSAATEAMCCTNTRPWAESSLEDPLQLQATALQASIGLRPPLPSVPYSGLEPTFARSI